MLFAEQNGIKSRANPKERGICRLCNNEVIAHCGNHNIWHWKHRAKATCDSWESPMSEWHTQWQLLFPSDLVEVVISNETVSHRADVKTSSGVIIEFQNSSISVDDIKKREEFYGQKMFWVINEEHFEIIIYRLSFNNLEGIFQSLHILDNFKPEGYKEIQAIVYNQKKVSQQTSNILIDCGFELDNRSGFFWKNLTPFKIQKQLIDEIYCTAKNILTKQNNENITPKIGISFYYKNRNPAFIWAQSKRHIFIDLGEYLLKTDPVPLFDDYEEEDWDEFDDLESWEFDGTIIPRYSFVRKYTKEPSL